MIFKGKARANVAVREAMQLGKLLTLNDAAQRFAELDNGVVDLRWTLRFCLEAYVRICIRLPYPINTWERRQQPDVGERCGRCSDIEDERKLCMYEDADEADMPQYCENCHMTKPPIMGRGDYIGQRWGVLFLSSLDIAELTMHNVDVAEVDKLFDFDDLWDGGYCSFEIASDRDVKQAAVCEYESIFQDNELADLGLTEILRKQVESASDVETLTLALSDLFVWKEDFKNALEGIETESRKDLLMNSEEATVAKTSKAVKAWIGEYAEKNGIIRNKPMSDEQLKMFREAASKVGIAPSTFDTTRRIEGFTGKNRAKKIEKIDLPMIPTHHIGIAYP